MPTKDRQVNITLDASTLHLLAKLAKQRDMSVATLSKKLILEALKHCENIALSALGEKRDRGGTQQIKHADAWK